MTRPGVPQWVACGKVAYPSQVEALTGMADAAAEARMRGLATVPRRAYRCRRCSRWHVSKRPALR